MKLTNIRKHIAKDLIGAGIIIVIALLVAAPIQFFGFLSTATLILTLLMLWLNKKPKTWFISLTRMALLVSVLGELFALGTAIRAQTIFYSLKLDLIITLGLLWAVLSYVLIANIAVNIESNHEIRLDNYKYPILIITALFLIMSFVPWSNF